MYSIYNLYKIFMQNFNIYKIYKNDEIYLYDTKFLKNISELLYILYKIC